ncbi:MAG: hypothetical protein ACREV9_09720 [Burkholderiales bacterium]
MTTYLFSNFFSAREQFDPNLFSRLQLYIAAHPDVETSCVLSNLFRALYTNSELFFIESLQQLDAASQNIARELMHAKASNAFPKEVWESALELIAALPAERGGFGNDPSDLAAKGFVPFAFAEARANADPAIGSRAWFRAWGLYFKWRLRRGASSAFAFAAQRGGFENFKYLWGAPAAAAVLAASFGVVMLDERLGMRQIILNSPPAQWVADLIEDTQAIVLEPLAEAMPENPRGPSAEPKTAVALIELGAPVAVIELEQPASLDESSQTEEPAPIAAADSASEPLPRSELIAAEGAQGRIAPRSLSSSERVLPREGNRPDAQTRPKPVAVRPPAAPLPEVPPAIADLPVIAKVVEKVEPVLDEVHSPPPAPEMVEPVVTAVEPPQSALPVEIETPVSAKDDADGPGNEQAAAPAFIQLLQSGGRREKASERGPSEAKAIERPLKRVDGPVAKVERSLVNGKVELPKAAAIDRIIKPERASGGERPQFDRPLALDKPIDRAVRPDIQRPQVKDRPPVLDRTIQRVFKPERPRGKL